VETRVRWDRPPDGPALLVALDRLSAALPEYLGRQRWFGGKGRRVTGARPVGGAPVPVADLPAAVALVEVAYAAGPPEVYLLPLAARRRGEATARLASPGAALGWLETPGGDWLVYDGLQDVALGEALLRQVEDARRLAGEGGELVFDRTPVFSRASTGLHPVPVDRVWSLGAEQSNTSIAFDDRLVLKVFRRPPPGESPDLEVSRFLTLRARFDHSPLLAGFAAWHGAGGDRTVAVLHTFVPNRGDGWTWSLEAARALYAAARRGGGPGPRAAVPVLAGAYLAGVRRLGQVTGELHAALAADPGAPAFAPEPVTSDDLAAWAAGVDAQLAEALAGLRAVAGRSAPALRREIERVVAAAAAVRTRPARTLAGLATVPLWKTRTHGDYHLGQVLRLASAEDFAIIDFEGEPTRPLAARRAKCSPLRDVAGMLRSLAYASWAGLFEVTRDAAEPPAALEAWRAAWEEAAAAALLAGYRAATVDRGLTVVPAPADAMAGLLSVFCLEKAAYELAYELDHRPDWLPIPLAAFTRELAGGSRGEPGETGELDTRGGRMPH
jgi:trehalose synthase-fused probable maltokinase